MIRSDNDHSRSRAAQIIAAGGVIGFRTDTFYGLGADPFNPAAVNRLLELKGRDDNKPILLLISDQTEIERVIASRTESFDLLAQHFWPGPLTIIGKAVENLPRGITAGSESVGVRLPDDEAVRELVETCGGPLTATSANIAGNKPAETAEEVQGYFQNGLDLVLDGGRVSATQPSTVIDARGDPIRIIREGAVSKSEIESYLKNPKR